MTANSEPEHDSNAQRVFELGVSGLDKLIGDLQGPYTLLILGHPGAGKTTLASMICYYNTLIGHKCLFISVYEDKEKLFRTMERFGLHMDQAEKRGHLRFIRLPISIDMKGIIDIVSRNVGEGFDLIVVDSISAILEPLKDNAERRAFLLNYFYQLPLVNNGLLILVSELPLGAQNSGYLTTEFIADAVLVLKHRIEDGFLVRELEIRKIRGKPIYIVEAPFSISEGRGVFVHAPTLLEELPAAQEKIEMPCKILAEKISHIHRDFFVNVFYPSIQIIGVDSLLILLGLLVKYNFRALIISYVTAPRTMREHLINILIENGIEYEKAQKVIDRHFIIKSLNPYAQSISELSLRELDLIHKTKPDVVVFHGTHVVKTNSYRDYFIALYNQMLYLKHLGVGVLRIGNCIEDYRCSNEGSISDLTFKVETIFKDNKHDYLVISYRRFKDPIIFTREEIKACVSDVIEYLKKTL